MWSGTFILKRGAGPDREDGGGHYVRAGVAHAFKIGHLGAFVEGLAVGHGRAFEAGLEAKFNSEWGKMSVLGGSGHGG